MSQPRVSCNRRLYLPDVLFINAELFLIIPPRTPSLKYDTAIFLIHFSLHDMTQFAGLTAAMRGVINNGIYLYRVPEEIPGMSAACYAVVRGCQVGLFKEK